MAASGYCACDPHVGQNFAPAHSGAPQAAQRRCVGGWGSACSTLAPQAEQKRACAASAARALGTDGRLFGGRSARERFLLPSLFSAVFGPDARNLRLRILDELLMQVNLLADRQGAFIHRLAGTVFFVKQSAQLAHPLRDGRVFRIDPHVQASDFQRVVGSIAQGAGIIADFFEKRHERFSFPGKTRLRFALALLGGHEGCEGSGLGLHQTGENG